MVTVAAVCDPEGGVLEEVSQRQSPATPPEPAGSAQVGIAQVDPAQADPAQADPAQAGSVQAGSAQDDWDLPTWEDIVRAHSARVYRLAYRLTGNLHDAEDLTQEVFVRVFRSLSSYTPGTFEGWLHRITTNLFLDSARRKQRIRFEGLADEMAHRLPGSEPSPAQAFDDSHLDDDVQAALKALPPEYRAAVVLCDIEGFSYEEIAATLGVKLGTVRSRIHRGRAQLRSALEHRRPVPVGVAQPATPQQAQLATPGETADPFARPWRPGLVPRRRPKRAGEP
jgi:RNA polymerase sigma factor (sigma-70 family)